METINGDRDLERRIDQARLAIISGHPFFATLALHAQHVLTDRVAAAATNGDTIFLAPHFVQTLGPQQLEAVMVHELLHCALDHLGRRGQRDPLLWNIAADMVVNRMIREIGQYSLPPGSIEDRYGRDRSVEEIYEELVQWHDDSQQLLLLDLPEVVSEVMNGSTVSPGYWKSALSRAFVLARQRDREFGGESLSGWRDVHQLIEPELDWRELLWRFVGRTPGDFSGFDRRFIWQRTYLDALVETDVRLAVAIDTSASVTSGELEQFMSELIGALAAYPRTRGVLFFADTILHGPHSLDEDVLSLRPVGGGGTDFRPFFEAITERNSGDADLAVYFTDGRGSFPQDAPDVPVLWVISTGGARSECFPFGDVVRLGRANPRNRDSITCSS